MNYFSIKLFPKKINYNSILLTSDNLQDNIVSVGAREQIRKQHIEYDSIFIKTKPKGTYMNIYKCKESNMDVYMSVSQSNYSWPSNNAGIRMCGRKSMFNSGLLKTLITLSLSFTGSLTNNINCWLTNILYAVCYTLYSYNKANESKEKTFSNCHNSPKMFPT